MPLTIQHKLSNGTWSDIDSADEGRWIEYMQKNNGVLNDKVVSSVQSAHDGGRVGLTRDEVIAALTAGNELRNDRDDWYSVCRAKPAPRPVREIQYRTCRHCHGQFTFGEMVGSLCQNCFDEHDD